MNNTDLSMKEQYFILKKNEEGVITRVELERALGELKKNSEEIYVVNIIKDIIVLLKEETSQEKKFEIIEVVLDSELFKRLLSEKRKREDEIIDNFVHMLLDFMVVMKFIQKDSKNNRLPLLIENFITFFCVCVVNLGYSESIRNKALIFFYGTKEESLKVNNLTRKDEPISSFIKLLKNKEGDLEEKKNVFAVLRNILLSGIKVQGLELFISEAMKIEESTMKRIKSENFEGREKEKCELFDLMESAHMLQVTVELMDRKNKKKQEEEEVLSYSKMKRNLEKECEEKEKLFRDKEKLEKEKEELKIALDYQTADKGGNEQIRYNSLSCFPIYFSDGRRMKSGIHTIVHNGERNHETCVLGGVLSNVYYNF